MTRPRKAFLGAAVSAALMLVLSSCGGGSAGGKVADSIETMDPITLTYTSVSAEKSAGALNFEVFAKEVEEKTGGKIRFEQYFNGSLLPGDETLEGIGSGVADAGFVMPSYYPQKMALGNWIMDLGSMPSNDIPHGMLAGSAAIQELQNDPDVLKEWSGHNIKVLNISQPGVGNALLCTKPIDSVEAAKGTRVRSGGGVWNAEIEAMGMVSVQVPAPETYEALQRGVVDCITAAPSTLMGYGWWDVAKHFIPVSMSAFNSSAQVINLEVWNSLPPDAQAVITEAAHRWFVGVTQEVLQNYARFATEGPAKHGIVFHDPTPLDALLKQHQEKFIAAKVASPPPGLADPQGLVDKYRALLDKWMAKTTEALGTPPPPRDPAAITESYIKGGDLDLSRFLEITGKELFPLPPNTR
ncbi:C4-dicarboxylate TRAP transporter substrate-binding protein [Pseudonocardia thermophila]|jgi:TRAP-type C4-dicarboxylate transport system, periplasmic component|uniref:C4-dicarboxylate TRAP transporter substrate-binding protein n=1 Tax=Pseudonocardia thermophila TaxID=1848 RepID=UPI00248DABDA|nr:C4-dicarboxylate TRAP transporter substrate-binding protein [Pseudonocardia thermophila]